MVLRVAHRLIRKVVVGQGRHNSIRSFQLGRSAPELAGDQTMITVSTQGDVLPVGDSLQGLDGVTLSSDKVGVLFPEHLL